MCRKIVLLIIITLLLGLSSSVSAALVGWWKLDNNANDSSGNGYNGTVTGASYVNDGTRGYVLDFEGADYVAIPSGAFSTITSQVTIALWLYGDAAFQPQDNNVFQGTRDGNRTLNAHVPWGTGSIIWDAGYTSTYDRISKAADSANQYEGQWNHWAFTKDTSSGQMKIYYNGTLWSSATGKTRSMSGTNSFKIGSSAAGTYNYDGMISDFRVYNTALTQDDIRVIAGWTCTISGTCGMLDGVTMSGLPGDPVTSGGGAYTATVDYGWNGVAAPVKEGYTFSPAERLYTNVTSNQSSQNFTPTLNTYTISGYVGLVEGVTMNGLPGNPSTDETGYYIGTVDYGWNGTVIPAKGDCAFEPAQRLYSYVVEDQNQQDYTTIADAHLVGWWSFDNSDANDSSGYGHNGTLTGDATIVDDLKRGKVLQLDGAGDYVDLGNGSWTNPGNHMTLAAWIKVDVYDASYQTIVAKGLSTYRLARNGTGNGTSIYMNYTSGSYMSINNSTNVNNGLWHHTALTYNGTTIALYVDGQPAGTNTLSTLYTTAANLCIGRNVDSTGRDWQGSIDDVRLYDRALSTSEIYGLYTASYDAVNPYPADGAKNVPVDSVLSWSAGYLAADVDGHDVYFGTSWADVNAAIPEVHMGLQSGTTFDPGMLQSGVTYFWEVNEVNDLYIDSPWTGKIWSFTTTDANLVGWWPLSGDALDHTGYGNNGTITGASWVEDRAMGTVLDFEGVDYVSIPSSTFSTINNQITIALWQNGDVALQPQNCDIFEGWDSSNHRVLNAHVPYGTSVVYWDAGYAGTTWDRINKTATAAQYEGQWNHWAFTKNTSTGLMKIYLNGELWHSGIAKTKSMSGITQFKIGSAANGAYNYDGMITDFRVYDKELSQTAINNIYIGSMRYEALNPSPANGAENVSVNTVLSWSAGYQAADVDGHDVYFGTNFDDVNAGIAAVHMGLQSGTTFNPGVLDSNVTYYWAVDEVNDLESGSPWLGQVWSFTTIGDSGLPPMPDDVLSNNSHHSPTMLGNLRGVAFPIKWPTVGCSYTQAQISNGARAISDDYYYWSRGKVQFVGMDGTGTQFTTLAVDDCAVPYTKVPSNQTAAQSYLADLFNIPNNTIKWYINSGNSTANSGGTTFDTYSMQAFTAEHELGHLFRLGHGVLLSYNSDGTYNSAIGYGDRTTNMGNVGAGGFNLPGYHRIWFIEEDEVAVFKPEDSGTVYRIRNIKKVNDTVNWAGVVYYMPVTGNRMWISVTERGSTYGENYLGNNLALTKYVTGWHMESGMQSTYCIKHMVGAHTDEFGLTYEVVAIDTSANRAWADIRITYNPANEICNKPLVIKQTQRLLQAVSNGTRGKMEVTIEVTNPNLPTTTPCLQQRAVLTVPNSYVVTKNTALAGIIPGGTTAKAVYVVESKVGPLAPQDAHLTASFQVAHLYPYKFNIDFE